MGFVGPKGFETLKLKRKLNLIYYDYVDEMKIEY